MAIKKKQQDDEAKEVDAVDVTEKKSHKHKDDHSSKIEKLEKSLLEALEKSNSHYDMYLRNMAEFDNFRKRSQKERENVYCDSVAEVVAAFLPVLDNFDRALNVKVNTEEAVAFKEGVLMILKQMKDTFTKIGVTEIVTEDQIFDPNLHDAVMHIEDEEYEAHEIVEELQKGYMFKDKVIRHSMVKVAN